MVSRGENLGATDNRTEGRTEGGESLAADGIEIRVRRCTTETSRAMSQSAFM